MRMESIVQHIAPERIESSVDRSYMVIYVWPFNLRWRNVRPLYWPWMIYVLTFIHDNLILFEMVNTT